MSEELKPCKLCGNQCDNCESEDGEGYYGCDSEKCPLRKLALTAEEWNRLMGGTPAPDALREAVKNLLLELRVKGVHIESLNNNIWIAIDKAQAALGAGDGKGEG